MDAAGSIRTYFTTIGILVWIVIPGFCQIEEWIETPVARGLLKNDRTVGVWEYYDYPGILSLKVDYDQGKVLFVHESSAEYVIQYEGQKIRSKLDTPCRFHGSTATLTEHYFKSFIVPERVANKAPIGFRLVFEVHPDGVARNPKIVNDPGYGVKESLLKAFDSAPNAWIAGKKNGIPVVTYLSIDFFYCADDCPPHYENSEDATTLLQNESHFGKVRAGIVLRDFLTQGLLWSPDQKKIYLTNDEISIDDQSHFIAPIHGVGYVLDLETSETITIPYKGIMRASWADGNRLMLNYQSGILPERTTTFDVANRKITSDDSIARFHITSNDGTFLTYLQYRRDGADIINVNTQTHIATKLIPLSQPVNQFPLQWSPNNDLLLIHTKLESYELELSIHKLATEKITVIPLINATPIGWSDHQRTLYLARIEKNSYSTGLSVFKYSIENNTSESLLKNKKNMTCVNFCNAADNFLIIYKDNLFIRKNLTDELKTPTVADVYRASWSPDGKRIAYLNRLDNQLYIFDVATNRSTKISTWNVSKIR
jgi:WD40 repeat protein